MTKKTNRLLLLLFFCVVSSIAIGQSKKTITGTVRDSTGLPLSSVTIHVKGTKITSLSDGTGNFKIVAPANASTLLITSVGYQPSEVNIQNNSSVNVVLKLAGTQLNEVVVTGFGETRAKRNLGYSAPQINGEEIRKTTAISAVDALVGMVPGLQVQSGISGPSATPRFLIRGSSSLDTYGNTPLIVVDNVIMDDQSVIPNMGGTDFGNILKDINPDDIESITVLKGGAVTSLYGSKAANGVILIKTKKGGEKKGLGVNVSHYEMAQKAYKTVDFQNRFGAGLGLDDFAKTPTGGLAINPASYGINWGPEMTGQSVLDVTGITRPNNPMPNNILGIYQTGLNSNTNASISGGSENSSFRFSYSNLAATAVSPNNKLNRNSFLLRGTQRISKIISLDAIVNYTNTITKNPALQGGNSPVYQIAYDGTRNYDLNYWKSHYIDPVKGGLNQNDPTYALNGIFFGLYQNNDVQTENNFRGGLDLTVNILPWLNFQGGMYVNLWNRSEENEQRGQAAGFGQPNYYSNINDLLTTRYRGTLNAQKKFNETDFSFQVGGETNTGTTKGASYGTNGGGILPDIYRISNSLKAPNISESAPKKQQLTSMYFQGAVSWRDLLSLNIYGRNEWNSTLVYNDGHGDYSYFYYGADAAFVFTDILKNKPKFIDFGKLRLSYNSAGGGTIPYTANTGAYGAVQAYGPGSSTVYPTADGNYVNTYAYQSTVLGNQKLIPQRVNTVEGGLEVTGFKKRVSADITYYYKSTNSQIINFPVPNTSGISATLLNGGQVTNQGIEITLNGTPVLTNNFKWTTQLNYARNRNKVVSLPYGVLYQGLEGDDGIRTVAKAGGEYGLLVASYGYARYQAKDGSGNNMASPLNGQPLIGMRWNNSMPYYLRATNVGSTPDSKEPVIGSTQPKFLASMRNTFTYKGFSLSVFLDSKIGGLEYSTTYFYGQQTGSLKTTLPGRTTALGGLTYTTSPAAGTTNLINGLAPNTQRTDGIALEGVFAPSTTSVGLDGQNHDVSGMTFKDAYAKGYVTPADATDYYITKYSWSAGIREAGVFENSWVSLREISIGYDLPKTWVSKLKLANIKASLIGRNLLYIYNSAPDHVNPDNLNDSGSGAAFERGGIPYIRSYGFKIDASF